MSDERWAWLIVGAATLAGCARGTTRPTVPEPVAPRTAMLGHLTKNVVLVVIDGVRWQEVFSGADSSILFEQAKPAAEMLAARAEFWRSSVEQRRKALMPFLWSSIADSGTIFGNRARGARVEVSNGFNVSYPGYAEMLTGKVDPRIRSNSFGRNPDTTVFDWLSARPAVAGRVAAYGTWDKFDDIFNRARAAFPIHSGWAPPVASPSTAADSTLNDLYGRAHREWAHVSSDALLDAAVLREIRTARPHLLFIGFGETDEWAHDGRYDNVLRSARAADAYVAELWSTIQRMPDYHGSTTLIVTTDHGRGDRRDWRDHGADVPGSEAVWIAIVGPDTPALGEHVNVDPIATAQIAATIAALFGEDYAAAVPGTAAPIAGVIRP